MKKIIVSALGLMLGGTLLATSAHAAVEHQFGGYWRTRFDFMDNGKNYPGDGAFVVDTRTRIYYTAKFNDSLKFVNKFEANAKWGDTDGGDIGADGNTWRVKNSYVDATFNAVNVKLGITAYVQHRGVLFDDDFSGAVVKANFGAVTPSVAWVHAQDKDFGGQDYDRDILMAAVSIKAGDMVTINPGITFTASSSDTVLDEVDGVATITPVGDENLIWVGVDVDAKLDPVKVWGTFVYQTGDVMGVDSNAFAAVVGADAGIVHGKFFYATGDDGSDPTENTAYTPLSPYVPTAEIMGIGTIDSYQGPQSTGFGFTNLMYVNVGTVLKPMENLTLGVDGWYGALAENNEFGNTDVGFEIDGKATMMLLEDLKAEIFAAYLIAGDATNDAAGNTDDVIELGMRLSLSF